MSPFLQEVLLREFFIPYLYTIPMAFLDVEHDVSCLYSKAPWGGDGVWASRPTLRHGWNFEREEPELDFELSTLTFRVATLIFRGCYAHSSNSYLSFGLES